MRSLAVLVALWALAAPVRAQTTVVVGGSLEGFSVCDKLAGPLGYVRIDVLLRPDGGAVVRHELKHMEQMRRKASCAVWTRAYQVEWPQSGVESEAEAFCENVKYSMEVFGWRKEIAIDAYAARLVFSYPFKLRMSTAREALGRYC